jgi:class 3 adenylate cyclase
MPARKPPGLVSVPVAREQRKLAAILAADVVGYSRLMGRDESGTRARLQVVLTKPWPVAHY